MMLTVQDFELPAHADLFIKNGDFLVIIYWVLLKVFRECICIQTLFMLTKNINITVMEMMKHEENEHFKPVFGTSNGFFPLAIILIVKTK